MHPVALMFSGLFLPIALLATLLLPTYIAVFGGLLIVYAAQAEALLDTFFDVSYVQGAYEQAFDYWWQNLDKVDHISYSLPIAGLPALGVFISLWSTYRLGSWAGRYFRMVM